MVSCGGEDVAASCWEDAAAAKAAWCSGGKLVWNACSPSAEELAGVGGSCWEAAAAGGGSAPEPAGELTGTSASLEALKLRVAFRPAAKALPPKPSADAVGDGGAKPAPEEVRPGAGTGGSAATPEALREGPCAGRLPPVGCW